MSTELRESIALPDGVTATVSGDGFTIKGKKGEIHRRVDNPNITITAAGKELVFTATPVNKRNKTVLQTSAAHARNMVRGAQEGHLYKLKICSGHFPMNVAVSGSEFVIKNFLGEKSPRKLTIRQGVSVKVQGVEVVVEAADKELAGMTAAAIEQVTKIANRDRRVFQDGIYITVKDGKEVI